MTSDSEGTITQFFVRLREGDQQAAEKLWEHFCPRLLGLARNVLNGARYPVVSAEDAVQSAFLSFWQRAEKGEFPGQLDRDNLWNLLGMITVRKANRKLERERAQKRGGGRVRNETALAGPDGEGFRLDNVLGPLPAQEFDLWCEELLLMLDEPLRTIAVLKLMGHKNREIACILECTERRVERKLQLIRTTWKGQLEI